LLRVIAMIEIKYKEYSIHFKKTKTNYTRNLDSKEFFYLRIKFKGFAKNHCRDWEMRLN
jgi:hypothetical protein